MESRLQEFCSAANRRPAHRSSTESLLSKVPRHVQHGLSVEWYCSRGGRGLVTPRRRVFTLREGRGRDGCSGTSQTRRLRSIQAHRRATSQRNMMRSMIRDMGDVRRCRKMGVMRQARRREVGLKRPPAVLKEYAWRTTYCTQKLSSNDRVVVSL